MLLALVRYKRGGDLILSLGGEFPSEGVVFLPQTSPHGDSILPKGRHCQGGDTIL